MQRAFSAHLLPFPLTAIGTFNPMWDVLNVREECDAARTGDFGHVVVVVS